MQGLGEWLLTAVVAFVIMVIADQILPGHRLTLPVIAAAIGAAILGKLSYTAQKHVVRRVRSRREVGS
jgi:hypothetical protein